MTRPLSFTKRLALAATVLLATGCAQRPDTEVLRLFQEAQEIFDQARSPDDFLKAAALYQAIVERNVVSGAVLYNQGNALMQAGERGRAIAAYRQAQRYRPRDPLLDANLRYALGVESAADRRRPLVEHLLFWQDWLSYPEKFHLAGAGLAATLTLGLVALGSRRRLWARLALAAAAVSLLLVFSAGYDWYRYDATTHGVIVQRQVIARKGDGLGYEPAFTAALAEGTEWVLIARRGGWLLVRLADGQQGWVPEDAAVLY